MNDLHLYHFDSGSIGYLLESQGLVVGRPSPCALTFGKNEEITCEVQQTALICTEDGKELIFQRFSDMGNWLCEKFGVKGYD